ncbi:hypothetical protein Esti_006231 [Eimeria stiedai]
MKPEQHPLLSHCQELMTIATAPEILVPNVTTIMEHLQGTKFATVADTGSASPRSELPMTINTKAPAAFALGAFSMMPLISNILGSHLAVKCIVSSSDVLVISPLLGQHIGDMGMVKQSLRERGRYAKVNKCKFARTMLDYLGFTVGAEAVKPYKNAFGFLSKKTNDQQQR